MKKNILIIIRAVVIISLVIVLIVFVIANKQKEKKISNSSSPIPTVPEIELNSKRYINQLEKVKIKGTNKRQVQY